jgi:hypothetical protein
VKKISFQGPQGSGFEAKFSAIMGIPLLFSYQKTINKRNLKVEFCKFWVCTSFKISIQKRWSALLNPDFQKVCSALLYSDILRSQLSSKKSRAVEQNIANSADSC